LFRKLDHKFHIPALPVKLLWTKIIAIL